MALSSSIVWEIRPTGFDNNGGGYKPGSTGTDWSQQATAQYTSSTGATSGTSATIATALAANDMVGNILRLWGGTGAVQGFFEILSVVPGVSITVDANVTAGASSNLSFSVGGALATISRIGSNTANLGAVAGNTIWMRGSFISSTTDVMSCVGTQTLPIRISGYGTVRGDGYLGRTNGNGPLITTNMATINYSGVARLTVNGSWLVLDCLNLISAAAFPTVQVPTDGVLCRCRFVNSGTNAASCAIDFISRGMIYNCDAMLTGGSGGGGALRATAVQFLRIINNRISGPGVGINITGAANVVMVGNTVYGGTNAVLVTNTGGTTTLINNTLVGCSGDAVNIVASNTVLALYANNLITDNAGYGFNFNGALSAAFMVGNRTRDNVLGMANGGNGWVAAYNFEAVTTDTGGPETDYVNFGANDYSLIATSPAVAAGTPKYGSAGAFQPNPAGGGGGGGGQRSYVFGG